MSAYFTNRSRLCQILQNLFYVCGESVSNDIVIIKLIITTNLKIVEACIDLKCYLVGFFL